MENGKEPMTNQGLKEKYFAEKLNRWHNNLTDYANWLEDALIAGHESYLHIDETFVRSFPSVDELQPFLYWVFHKADRIWVEHTLGWRDNAIQEIYEAYLLRDNKN